MRKGRLIVGPALLFVAGDIVGATVLPHSPAFVSIMIFALSLLSTAVFARNRGIAAMLAAFALLGMLGARTGGIESDGMRLVEKAAQAKERFSEKAGALFNGSFCDEAAVVRALAIGDKSALDRELKENYKKSGAMHLLALSGLHIGIIYVLLSSILAAAGGSKPARIIRKILILGILWIYSFITGLGNSICRAVIMISVYEISDLRDSGKDLLRALAISAFLITLYNPRAPLQIGFQLSYCSMLAIHYIYPRLKKLLECRSRLLEYIWNTLAMSISCQAGTAPLSLIYFGTFPKYFMVTNLVAIPLTGVIMYLIPAAIILADIPVAGTATASALAFCLKLLNTVIAVIADL